MKLTYEDGAFNAQLQLWNDNAVMTVYVENLRENETADQEKVSQIMQTAAELINNSRKAVEQALLDDEMVALAEDWASSGEEVFDDDDESEQERYILPDGSMVTLPISKKDFSASLHIDSVLIYTDAAYGLDDAEVFIVCKPDYFLGHCIDVFIKKDGTVNANGLAG